jgi:hypothetical protein
MLSTKPYNWACSNAAPPKNLRLAIQVNGAYGPRRLILSPGDFAMKPILQTALLAVFTLAAALPAAAQEKSWVGETVVPIKPLEKIQFGDWVDSAQPEVRPRL